MTVPDSCCQFFPLCSVQHEPHEPAKGKGKGKAVDEPMEEDVEEEEEEEDGDEEADGDEDMEEEESEEVRVLAVFFLSFPSVRVFRVSTTNPPILRSSDTLLTLWLSSRRRVLRKSTPVPFALGELVGYASTIRPKRHSPRPAWDPKMKTKRWINKI